MIFFVGLTYAGLLRDTTVWRKHVFSYKAIRRWVICLRREILTWVASGRLLRHVHFQRLSHASFLDS